MLENHVINEKLPATQMGVLGLQHVLVMYASAIMVPIILGDALGLSQADIAFLVSADIFTCGIATLLQVIGIKGFAGIRLPVMMGATLMTLPPMIAIGQSEGITAVFGSIIISGLFVVLVSFRVLPKLIKFFPPVVTGSLVTIVGLSLTAVGIRTIAEGAGSPTFGSAGNYLLALLVIVSIMVANRRFTGFLKAIAVLIGLVIGTVVGYFMGMVDFTPVAEASWFHFITPFHFGMPTFSLNGAIAMSLVMTMAMVESVGIFTVIGEICGVKLNVEDFAKGVRAEGIAQVLGGLFNAFPYMTFSQNAGLMEITGVKSRYTIISAGGILIALGLLPKFAALATIIPGPVLGGAMVVVFGMIGVVGIRVLGTLDLTGENHNLLIVAASLGVGVGISVTPNLFTDMPQLVQLICGNGIFMGALTALLLNLYFNYGEIVKVEEAKVAKAEKAEMPIKASTALSKSR